MCVLRWRFRSRRSICIMAGAALNSSRKMSSDSCFSLGIVEGNATPRCCVVDEGEERREGNEVTALAGRVGNSDDVGRRWDEGERRRGKLLRLLLVGKKEGVGKREGESSRRSTAVVATWKRRLKRAITTVCSCAGPATPPVAAAAVSYSCRGNEWGAVFGGGISAPAGARPGM